MGEAPRFTGGDAFRTVVSVLMVVLGAMILARTLPLGFHVIAFLVGACFIGLGAYRLSFVIRYFARRRGPA